MDFTGFRTNPKKRIAEYNDTYDQISALNTVRDSFHWHYHHPPHTGIGDQWSQSWDSSNEYINILGNRLLHRNTFPAAFRAGGTIEDNDCSHWLEDHFMIDYSNRVTHRSYPTDNIFDFNWYGAPSHWGFYHPNRSNFQQKGSMKRYIARCVDAKSRFHTISQSDVNDVFSECRNTRKHVIFSYFSHDHRDMRAETKQVISFLNAAAKQFGVSYAWCDAVEAIRIADNIADQRVKISVRLINNTADIRFSDPIYQKHPFVYTLHNDGQIIYHKLENRKIFRQIRNVCLNIDPTIRKIGIACHSLSGHVSIKIVDLRR